MLQKKLCLVVTFDATAAMAAEKYCLERGVPGRLIPVPREITTGCGLAWKAEVDQEEAVTAALEAAGIAYSGVHRVII
ncbi:DUF3343 domain-containing protein [Vescimonas sp.]|uniref:DUF3343 domain-containing protein n=1 Tax=Vescimonas sp. TaxID=2892404 RepID=UPI00307B9953